MDFLISVSLSQLICRLHFDFDAVEKHPIDAFSYNVKTARPRLKTDTIASIEKKSLLSTGKYTGDKDTEIRKST